MCGSPTIHTYKCSEGSHAKLNKKGDNNDNIIYEKNTCTNYGNISK
jgi:hypothetical protein